MQDSNGRHIKGTCRKHDCPVRVTLPAGMPSVCSQHIDEYNRIANRRCARCGGDGVFASYFENGRKVGGGTCYWCLGTGSQRVGNEARGLDPIAGWNLGNGDGIANP